jgi:ribosomal protein S18 acetylase RimI-like enzyme
MWIVNDNTAPTNLSYIPFVWIHMEERWFMELGRCEVWLKRDEKYPMLYNVVTNENHRRRGIATRLINKAIAWCRDYLRASHVDLNVRQSNLEAISLYKKLGFVVVGTLGGDKFRMRKALYVHENRNYTHAKAISSRSETNERVYVYR